MSNETLFLQFLLISEFDPLTRIRPLLRRSQQMGPLDQTFVVLDPVTAYLEE